MELFYSQEINEYSCRLDRDEFTHCIKVLRHKEGDEINVADGKGDMHLCRITDIYGNYAEAEIIQTFPNWHSHLYSLTMAVCPTKNIDRYEWFAEKATELGIDKIVPVIGQHSERKVVKTERLERIVLSAMKQSLKALLPVVEAPVSVKDFLLEHKNSAALKLIAYCFEGETKRTSIVEALRDYSGSSIIIMIGPEGDFSEEEVGLALDCGFVPIHLGESRLRTETAALTAVEAVYIHNI